MQDFYEPSQGEDMCQPAKSEFYSSLIGHLIVVIKTRPEIRPFISHLSKQTHPNRGDECKAIYVLRYLYSTRDIRSVYDGDDTTIYGQSDSAFCFHWNGACSYGFILSAGRYGAPFMSQAKAQTTIAPDIVAGEYYAAFYLCLVIAHFRQLAAELGWPQPATPILMDSQSAINLALAPIITKKARHMKVKYHLIRDYARTGLVKLHHIPASEMRADILTKVLSKTNFIKGRAALLNMPLP